MWLSSRKLPWGLLLCLLWATAPGLRAQTARASVELTGYVADLRTWSGELARLPDHPEQAEPLRRSIPLMLEVQTSAQRYTVSNAWLIMALVHWEKQAPQRAVLQRQMAQRLQWELEEVEALSRPPEAPLSRLARAQLAAVLSRREFRFVRAPSWWDLMWARVWRWLGRLMEKLLRRLHLKPAVSNVLSWVLLGAAFLLLALLLWRNLRRSARGGLARLGLEAPAATGWGWRQWADAARSAAGEQRYREAVHCSYWAAVFRLEEMRVWRLDAARTPREYLRLLPRDSRHRPVMASLTHNFEMVWYGYRPATSEQAQSALQELENLECSSPSIAATASY